MELFKIFELDNRRFLILNILDFLFLLLSFTQTPSPRFLKWIQKWVFLRPLAKTKFVPTWLSSRAIHELNPLHTRGEIQSPGHGFGGGLADDRGIILDDWDFEVVTGFELWDSLDLEVQVESIPKSVEEFFEDIWLFEYLLEEVFRQGLLITISIDQLFFLGLEVAPTHESTGLLRG